MICVPGSLPCDGCIIRNEFPGVQVTEGWMPLLPQASISPLACGGRDAQRSPDWFHQHRILGAYLGPQVPQFYQWRLTAFADLWTPAYLMARFTRWPHGCPRWWLGWLQYSKEPDGSLVLTGSHRDFSYQLCKTILGQKSSAPLMIQATFTP